MRAVTSLWPQKVRVCESQIYSARAKLKLISDRAKDLAKQDAVGAYIWAWLYYAYDTFNMPYCS